MSEHKAQSKGKNGDKAIALKYNPQTDAAPIIVASGYGYVAEKIIDIADQSGIPIYRDDTSANMLAMLEIGSTVPPQLFEVIAAVYIDLLHVAQKAKEQRNASQAEEGE